MGLTFEQWQRLGWTLTALFFLMAVLGLVGEILGWWNDTGEILITVGAIASIFLGVATLFGGAGRGQVAGVQAAVEVNGFKLDSVDTKLDKLEKLDDLDRIQFELDEQTGVLRDIRDLL